MSGSSSPNAGRRTIKVSSALAARREAFFKPDTQMPAATTTNGNGFAATADMKLGKAPIANGESGEGYENGRAHSPPRGAIYNGPSRSGPPTAPKETIIQGYVGFASIPNQVYRKAIKRGFEFSLMIVGQSGLGKSTFINSLFLTDVYPLEEYKASPDRVKKTSQIEEHVVKLQEKNVHLTLTLVDTPGFGNAVNNSNCWDPILQYLDRKYTEYFAEETKINRMVHIPDKRVHCCLYFIAPTGHGLLPIDIECMKRLHDRVNIIPVIAKADTLTQEELAAFKKVILAEINEQKIKIYDFPESDDDVDSGALRKLKLRVPFAVIGSNCIQDVDGKKARCRRYPWGVVEVENLDHNDFLALRDMLIRTHMCDLIEVTRSVHYENFRLRQLHPSGIPTDKDPFTGMEDQKRDLEQKIRAMEEDMEGVFQAKLREKMQKMKDFENDYERRREQQQKTLEQKRQEIAQKRQQFEQEKEQFQQSHPEFSRYTSSDSLGKDKKKKHMF